MNTLEDLTDSVNHAMRQFHLPEHSIEEIRTYVGNGAAISHINCVRHI